MRKKLVYLCLIASLIGASVVSVDLRIFQLSIFRALIIIIALIMLLETLMTNKGIHIGNESENNYSIIFMLVWLLYAFFTLGWVNDYGLWIRSVYFIGSGFLCVVIFNRYLRNKFDIIKAFQLVGIMIIFHNLIGWYEVITGDYWFLQLDRMASYSSRSIPVSMFNNANDYATFMLFSVFITYICAINTKSIIFKLIYITTIISSVSLLVMTGSRSNVLGLIFAVAVFVRFSFHNKRTRRTLSMILLLGFMVILFRPEYLSNLVNIIDQNIYFGFFEQSGTDFVRINLIKNGLLFLVTTFGFGTGAGNIEYWMGNYGTFYTGSILNIHNWWMEILVDYGLIIFIMYLIFYIKLFLSNYRKFKRAENKTDMSISLGIMCCMAGFVIGSISSSSNISSEWLWTFWAIAITYQGIEADDILP